MKKKLLNRRSFAQLLGKGSLSVALLPYMVTSCKPSDTSGSVSGGIGILPSDLDELILAEGLDSQVIIKWKDPINDEDHFGFNNDYLCFIPFKGKEDEGYLWANHEYVNPLFIHGNDGKNKTKEEIDKEIYEVGGSILHIKYDGTQWQLLKDPDVNKRISGFTNIPFNWDEPIEGATAAMGTLGNCAGGITPWGTFLTCEENYQDCYGDRSSDKNDFSKSFYGWENVYPNPPEHYGWVVEVDPDTGNSQKHIALGRCAHECATIVSLDDGRLVVYTGDDKAGECLYKFISSEPNSLKKGTLYAADVEKGKWIPVDIELSPALKEKFRSQTKALTYLRESARVIGASRLDRPEDIEIDPVDGSVLVALTNNIAEGNYFGSILKIEEENNEYDSLSFTATTFLSGGEDTGFASPDNMVFDRTGNLWFTSDISGSKMNKSPYKPFKNNGLFLVMRAGEDAGRVIQMASAPKDAELTGPWFSPDGKTLFLSVQHPGEQSKSLDDLSSHWPDGGNSVPKPAVIAISGPLLEKIQNI